MFPSVAQTGLIPLAELKEFVRQHEIQLQNYGGSPFPFPAHYPNSSVRNRKNGISVLYSEAVPLFHDWKYEFWELDSDGTFVSRSSVDEDHSIPSSVQPRTVLGYIYAILDVCLPLTFAQRLCRARPSAGSWQVRFRWSGMAGRILSFLGHPGRVFHRQYKCHDDVIDLEAKVDGASELSSIAIPLVEAVFWLFGWENAKGDQLIQDVQSVLDGWFPGPNIPMKRIFSIGDTCPHCAGASLVEGNLQDGHQNRLYCPKCNKYPSK